MAASPTALLLSSHSGHPKLRNITPVTDGSFTLNVDHFYPKEISVTWEIFQPPSSKTPQNLESTDVMQENPDGTFNVTSTTESLRDKVIAGEEYTLRATVTHRKLKHPSYKEWTPHQNKDNTHLMSSPELGEILTPNLTLNSQTPLQCTISRFYPDNLTVNWIRKVKGNEEIMKTSEKYKITPHTSQQQRDKTFTCTACLLLTPSLEDQGAEIICRVAHPSLEQPAERSTGRIQVCVKPTLDHPIQLSIGDSGDVIAALSLLKFYPKDIRITWSDGQSPEKKPSEERAAENPDGTFSITTRCTIPGQSFNDLDFKLKVTWKHKTMDRAESREMSVRDADFPWRPRIVEMTPLILQMGKQTAVTCKISMFFPDNLTVNWYEKVGESVTPIMDGTYKMSIKPERTADNLRSCSASLSFMAQSQPEDLEFICKVIHPSLKDPIERSTGKAKMRAIPKMVRPVTLTPGASDTVTCSMSLLKFYPSSINITWNNMADNKPIPSTRKLIQTDEEQTFDATSECTVPWKDFRSGVRVTWEHESLTSPQHHDLRVTDLPWRPVVEEIEKPVFHVNTEARLQCKISQYFPNDLTVAWYKKRTNWEYEKLNENTTPSAERQPDNTYSYTASLVVRPSIQDHDGAEIICRVQHPSSGQHMEISTGPIQVYASPRMQEPIRWSLRQRGKGLCTLSLQGFYPKPIEIKWSCSSHSEVTSRETYEENPDSTYDVRSECTVTQENIDDPDFRIIVTWSHQSLGGPEMREMYIRDTGLPSIPEVGKIITPTIISLNKKLTLHCDINTDIKTKLTVTWYVKERTSHEYVPVEEHKNQTELKKEQRSDSGHHYKASLQLGPLLRQHHGIQFKCKVNHPSLDFPIERTTGPILISLTPQMVKPVKLTPGGSDTVTCSMSLLKFYPSNINITWTKKHNSKPIPSTTKPIPGDKEQTFDATSECTVPWKAFRSGVRVTWEHESLTSPQHHDLRVTDLPWRPVVEEIEKPVFHVNTEARLQCKISQYFPNDLTVTWYRKTYRGHGKLTENTTPTAERRPDNTYSCTASLVVRPSIQDHDGAEIICRVQHPSSGQHVEKSTGPIQVYGDAFSSKEKKKENKK
ncbi:uncharacterized protein LOC122945530 [Bufo gargarizans]|uniref:uncharacterized protein LOC122945530 n=1 Tax=Bufo gargarizans TaxID=30331 RepID=UPI001CF2533D|nr:uncharacterized protein LOC122945530 [Bufo gargarizans]